METPIALIPVVSYPSGLYVWVGNRMDASKDSFQAPDLWFQETK